VGAGASAAMLTAVLGDYFVYRQRGIATGCMGMTTGLGAIIAVFVFLKEPNIIQNSFHLSDIWAAKITYFTVAGFSFLSSFCIIFGLKGGVIVETKDAKFENLTLFQKLKKMSQLFFKIGKEGLLAAKERPVLALAYCAGLAGRGDSVIITTFLSLWINQAATAMGHSKTEAISLAGKISGFAQTFAIVWAPFAGIIAHKTDAVLALVIQCTIACVGYIGMFFVTDPLGTTMTITAMVIGMGEIGVIISSSVLVAKEAPPNVRGSVGGVFGFSGAVGVLIATKAGGYLFDTWRKQAPFLMFGIFNGIVVMWGVTILLIRRMKK